LSECDETVNKKLVRRDDDDDDDEYNDVGNDDHVDSTLTC